MKEPGAAQAPVLIVDDDEGQRSLLETFLRAQGYRTQAAASGEAALQLLHGHEFALMISDVRMPGISGIETLRRARQEHPTLPVLLVTAFADIRSAVGAMRDGAVNYLAKPIDLDELLASVQLATDRRVQAPVPAKAVPKLPPGIITGSPLMQAVYRDAAVIAPSATRVLITGESGVGKEVVAELIHAWSPRAAGPVRQGQLRGDSGKSAGERAFRPREGRLHRRRPAAHRALRGGEQRDDPPRRDRRASARRSRRSCCGSCTTAPSGGSARTACSTPTRGCWRRPTATSRPRSPRGTSARTFSTGST